MSSTGIQSPLGINVTSSLIQNTGFNINPVAESYMGVSKVNTDYTPGSIVNDTCLYCLTYAMYEAYNGSVASATYDNLISIGAGTIPALGNSKPPTYVIADPSSQWTGQATTGYYLTGNTGQGQDATWIPYNTSNPNDSVTQWGYIRLHALQAWNEFNWNGIPNDPGMPEYRDFTSSFLVTKNFIQNNNSFIETLKNSESFMQGTYSNMNDMITGDISGVNLALPTFGMDCISLGKVIDLTKIARFGFPSTLLQTIKTYNALTPSLVLALLASGLTNQEIDIIVKNTGGITNRQEQQIYGAFLIIVGQDLLDILIPLNCKTEGLETLADLLNIKKMFPNSYKSMTVPLYNVSPSVTNSKTYYPIFEGDNVSSRITSPEVTAQIGTIIPPGPAPVVLTTEAIIQELSEGFGSYLDGILPEDIATSSGAFAYSMQQIKNIQFSDFEKFAQIVSSLEVNRNLTQINGTNVPVDTALVSSALYTVALGSGPNGSYTTSDFFGCMSGLPYLWNDIYKGIVNLQTTKLNNIYEELYLACTWEGITLTVQYTTAAGPTYTVTGINITDTGGGYCRGGAPVPTITITNGGGATATCTIGTDPRNIATYGRITGINFVAGGSSAIIPTVSIQYPPTATLAVNADGSKSTSGTNTASGTVGWPTMDTIVQAYIDQANAEIPVIQSNNSILSNNLNIAYNAAGNQLTIEQRARYIGIAAVPDVTRDTKLNPSPVSLINFVDAIPTLAASTEPHMYSQTLEAISNMNTIGGQSLIGMLRQTRNQARLQELGIPLDNNIPENINTENQKTFIANGSIPDAINTVNGTNGYTLPSNLILQNPDGSLIAPIPAGYYDSNNQYRLTEKTTAINEISPISEILTATGTGVVRAGVRLPLGNGTEMDIGEGYLGSLAGSPYSDLLPPNLNGIYISATISPATYTVNEAIDEVIRCNCDCWVD